MTKSNTSFLQRLLATEAGWGSLALRIAAGAAMVAAAMLGFMSPIGFVGLIPLLTGLVGYCPAYRFLGHRP